MAEILVAMSGGVDSSVAAALLVDQGHDVVGVTLKLWGGESDSGCCSVSDVEDARRVAQQLDIDHHVFNFGDEFDEFVVDPYVAAHQDGLTPNPCVECNRHIKFDKLFRRADALGFDLVATGHHAQVAEIDDGDEKVFRIRRGADAKKDQSYVLHMLDQSQLRRLMLPVGSITKERVRELAIELDLRTADKPDSQDVCFIHSKGGREAFLGDRIPLKPAKLVDTSGSQVGSVSSVELVTIGQRRGLNLGGDAGRRYVVDIDRQKGEVTVGERSELLTSDLLVTGVEWSNGAAPGAVTVQCSAHGSTRKAVLSLPQSEKSSKQDQSVLVTWAQPQPKVAVGQSVVFYDGEDVLGGGIAAQKEPAV